MTVKSTKCKGIYPIYSTHEIAIVWVENDDGTYSGFDKRRHVYIVERTEHSSGWQAARQHARGLGDERVESGMLVANCIVKKEHGDYVVKTVSTDFNTVNGAMEAAMVDYVIGKYCS